MANLTGSCPICDAEIKLNDNVEESEILTCTDCKSRIVVEKFDKDKVVLNEAPKIEEDWGQ